MDRPSGLLDHNMHLELKRDRGKVVDKTFGDVMVPRLPIPMKNTNLHLGQTRLSTYQGTPASAAEVHDEGKTNWKAFFSATAFPICSSRTLSSSLVLCVWG